MPSSTMKKYICILASAALLAACEQKTETTAPEAASPTATTTPAETTPATTPAEATTTTSPTGAYRAPVLWSAGVCAAQLFAIVFGADCGKLCGHTSSICEMTFGLCSLQGVLRRLPVIVRWKMNGCVWQSALLSSSDARFCSFFC